jgi:hypothetical protein
LDDDPDFNNTTILEIVRSFTDKNILYYKNKENLKLFNNLNRCAVLSKSKYFALLHDDDILLSNYIDTILPYLVEKNPDALCVGYDHLNYPFIAKNTNLSKNHLQKCFLKFESLFLRLLFRLLRSPSKLVKIPISANLFLDDVYGAPSCGMVFKRETFLQSGGYNQDYYPSGDWIFMIFFSKKYKTYFIKKKLAFYIWENNLSTKKETLLAFKDQRKLVIESLVNQYSFCRLLFYFLHADFLKKVNSPVEIPISHSFLYNVIARIYSIKIKE